MRLPRRLLPRGGAARRDLAAAIACGTLGGALLVVQADLLSRAVDGAFLGGRPLAELLPLLGGLAAVALVRALGAFGQEALAQRAAGAVRLELRAELGRRIFERGPAFVAGERSGELAHAFVDGVEATDGFVAQYLPQLALAILVPLLLAGAVLPVDPLSGVVLLVTYPLIPFFMALIGAAAQQRSTRQWLTLARMSAQLLDALRTMATLKAFGRSREHAAVIGSAAARFRELTLDVLKTAFVSALVLELVATLATAIVAVEVGLRLLYGRLAFREALFVLVLTPEFYRPLRALGAAYHASLSGIEAAKRIDSVVEAAPEPAAAVAGDRIPRDVAAAGVPALELRGVGYRYPDGDRPALQDVSFRLEPGTTLALVGPSGSGKTTLTHLLLRFREPSAGEIRVDGTPLATIAPEAWRRRIAWVPQRPHLFHGSVRDNLRLARPDADDAELSAALARARAEGLLHELERGLDTPVGEGGARLSLGQVQRLALARAFLRDAPLIVLDEPTAQLDAVSEAAFQAGLDELRRGRSVLLIAHRLNTVERADRIVLLEAGRVAEAGRHAELERRGGAYARLVALARGDA